MRIRTSSVKQTLKLRLQTFIFICLIFFFYSSIGTAQQENAVFNEQDVQSLETQEQAVVALHFTAAPLLLLTNETGEAVTETYYEIIEPSAPSLAPTSSTANSFSFNSESNLFNAASANDTLTTDQPSRHLETISEYEIEGGVYDFRLSEAYMDLGMSYQSQNEIELSNEAFNQALSISRISNGLYHQDQLPIVQQIVKNHITIGDLRSANSKQEYLLFVQQKNYEKTNPIHIEELIEYADWNLQASILSLGYSVNIEMLKFSSYPVIANYSGRSDQFQQTWEQLTASMRGYRQSLELIALSESEQINETPTPFNPLIPELEKKLAYTFFLLSELYKTRVDMNSFEIDEFNSFNEGVQNLYFLAGFREGRDALQRRYSYLQKYSNSAEEIINALIDTADWALAFERWSLSRTIYEDALELMSLNGLDELEGLTLAGIPKIIPDFLSNNISTKNKSFPETSNKQFKGYLDVNFDINRYGSLNQLKILAKSPNTSNATERALIRELRRTKYRLQFEKNTREFSEKTYTIRYFYNVNLSDQ